MALTHTPVAPVTAFPKETFRALLPDPHAGKKKEKKKKKKTVSEGQVPVVGSLEKEMSSVRNGFRGSHSAVELWWVSVPVPNAHW